MLAQIARYVKHKAVMLVASLVEPIFRRGDALTAIRLQRAPGKAHASHPGDH
jgi:hypothetical protein